MSPKLAKNISKLGTESAFEILQKASELSQQGKDIINLGIGQPDFPTPKHIIQAAKEALDLGYNGYTPSNGIFKLREAVSKDILKRRNTLINPANIVIVPGGKVTMWHAILMFGEVGSEIIYPDPGFPIYKSVIDYSGAKAIPLKTNSQNNFKIDLDNLFSLMNKKTKLIIFNSPANPTGNLISKNDLSAIAYELNNYPDIAILSDEIYSRIIYNNMTYPSLLEYENIRDRLIVLDGWSKTYSMTGWRIGYGIWPSKWAKYAERLNTNSNSCTNIISQYAAIAALDGPQKCVDDMVQAFNIRRKTMVEGLNNIPGFECPDSHGAFYAMPNITKTKKSSLEMQNILLYKLGISAIAGTSFGKHGEGCIRFSYANSEKNIKSAISRMYDYSKNSGW